MRFRSLEDIPLHMQPEASTQLFTKHNAILAQAHHTSPGSLLERSPRNEPLATPQSEAIHSGRYVVRVVSYRQRLLDEDNLSAKYFCDGLRYAGLLPEDSPAICQILTTQIKVQTKAEQRTEITIDIP